MQLRCAVLYCNNATVTRRVMYHGTVTPDACEDGPRARERAAAAQRRRAPLVLAERPGILGGGVSRPSLRPSQHSTLQYITL